MSDEPIRLDQPPASIPSGIFEHYCEHPRCEAWGAYGYQIGKQQSHFYCLAHRGEGERLIGRR
jgi:hypothetical protein